ncbi:MAG: flippase-like domain-containing protein [Chloroflexi bacterium]|nr:flippase-like domain-containing protein [Chloroflexota bacterium]
MNPFFIREMVRVKGTRIFRGLAVYSLLTSLLYFALRNAPLPEIWETLKQLRLWQIAALIMLNAAIYLLVTLRWWLIVKAEKRELPLLPLLAVRVSVFGLSYFTFGPQVGGEPLQVLYLQRKYGMTYTRATSTVIMDKLIEFLANFFLLGLGLTAVVQAGILSTNGSSPIVSLIGLVILMIWPPIHIALLFRGIYPITSLLRGLPFVKKSAKAVRFIAASERMAGAFCRRHLAYLISAIFVSLFAAMGMVGEFFFITSFLQIELSSWQTISAWTASWLAFLVPLPGGLGALEASQVFALGMFSVPAASAISVTLILRGRDLLIGGIGLLLAGQSAGTPAREGSSPL